MKKQAASLLLALCLICGLVCPLGLSAQAAAALVFPVNNGCKIAYYYGYTKEYGGTHRGLDIHAGKDKNIYAAASGTVVTAFNSCSHVNAYKNPACKHGWGNYIKIKDKSGRTYTYGHLKKGTLKVKKGQKVVAGQKLATMGSSGPSTGVHLHFEVQDSKGKLMNVNPASGKYSYKGKNFTYKNGPYNTKPGGATPTPSPTPTPAPELPSEVTVSVENISQAEPEDVYPVGSEIKIRAGARDADKITIFVACNGQVVHQVEGEYLVYVLDQEGDYEIYALAENAGGAAESAHAPLTVKDPAPPTDVQVSVSKSLDVVGETITISASASNADIILIMVEWNGTLVQTKTADTMDYTFTDPGEYAVYAVAYNQDGEAMSPREEMTVRPAEETPDPDPAARFTDLAENHYARKAINWALDHNVAGGKSETVFGVGHKCSRAQAVFFIWAAEGRPEPTLAESPFADVKPGAYYYKAVLWAKERGITGGKSAAAFDPEGDVTRGQIMTFLYAAKGRPAVSGDKNFSDVASGDYYCKAVAWAAEKGVSSGKGAGTFKPKANCKREEIVTFLYQAYK